MCRSKKLTTSKQNSGEGQLKRDDGQIGYNCSIFRNESERQSSDIILEAESRAVAEWGDNRGFTYINPESIANKINPGYCFKCAGWRLVKETHSGLHLLEKLQLGEPPTEKKGKE